MDMLMVFYRHSFLSHHSRLLKRKASVTLSAYPCFGISGNQSECSHKPYHSSLSSYPSNSYNIHVTHILCWCRSGQSCAFLIFTQNYLSLPRQFAEQSISGTSRLGKQETLRLLWLFDVVAPLTVNYEAHFYALEMPGIGHTPLICIREVINRRGLKRDGAVSGSGQLSTPLSVTGRERQTDKYSSTLRNSTAEYLLLLKCVSTTYSALYITAGMKTTLC